jgi:hypothetical protein
MAFEDYEIPTGPASSEEVFAIFLEHQRLCSDTVKYRIPPMLLTRESSIAEFENACHLADFPLHANWLNKFLGTSFTAADWKARLSPRRRKTLGALCDEIAPYTRIMRIQPITVLGATSLAAGAFMLLRKLLIDAGAPPDQIAPSSPLEPLLRDHPRILDKLPYLAPGRIPTSNVKSPTHTGLGFMLLLGKLMWVAGWLFHRPTMLYIGLANFGIALIALWTVGEMIKPARVQLGWLKTLRDLSETMVGEHWGMWRGFPIKAM